MTTIDWIALGFIGLSALVGLRRGLITTVLSLAGLVGGAVLGDRLAPHFLSAGSSSRFTPLVALGGALVGAVVLRSIALIAGSMARNGLKLIPPLHALDSVGGLIAGAVSGAVVVWIVGTLALSFPGQTTFRQDLHRSTVLRALDRIVAPDDLLHVFGRLESLPGLRIGPAALPPPTRSVLSDPAVRSASASVVKITAETCGEGVEGSGWVAADHLVVTAAHVVAATSGITVDGKPATVVAFDPGNDVAVLDVPALTSPPLRYADPREGASVAILGYPDDGPYTAVSGRIGPTETMLVSGTRRLVTEFSGRVRPGNSGGPALSGSGIVEATVFAKRIGSDAGFGVPAPAVSAALVEARTLHAVPTGTC